MRGAEGSCVVGHRGGIVRLREKTYIVVIHRLDGRAEGIGHRGVGIRVDD